MSHPKIVSVFAFVILVLPCVAAADMHVWVEPANRHVLRDEPPAAKQEIRIAAARNETRSVQILVRSSRPITIRDLRPRVTDPDSLRVRLFRQHQFKVSKLSPRNQAGKLGWYPDPLIPFVHPVTSQPLAGVIRAIPFELPADETHGFWADICVGPAADAGRKAIQFAIETSGSRAETVTVLLEVYGLALPDVPTMQTEFGSPAARMEGYYRQRAKAGKDKLPTSWPDIHEQAAGLCDEHRINATPAIDLLWPMPQTDGSFRIRPDRLAHLVRFVQRHHVNALCVPNVSNNACKDPVAERDKLRAWLHAYDEAAAEIRRQLGRDVTFFAYLIDEPNDAKAYEFTRKWGRAIRDAKSVVKVMVTEQPQPQDATWSDLYGAVDIWCPLMALFELGPAAERQKLGETVWVYTALTQGREPSPWWEIDYPLANYRICSWIAWRYRVRGLLYWGGLAHWLEVEDPWTDPWSYGHMESSKACWNGEGVLVYPARPVGFDGIVPSIRLKALRDGIQDYEYLAICERLGLVAEAEKVVLPLAESWFKWNADPAAYDLARAKLARMIVNARK